MSRNIGPLFSPVCDNHSGVKVSSAGQDSSTIATSGFTALAVTYAPRRPTSSWLESAATTLNAVCSSFKLSKTSAMAAAPKRSSKSLPKNKPDFSLYSHLTSTKIGQPVSI